MDFLSANLDSLRKQKQISKCKVAAHTHMSISLCSLSFFELKHKPHGVLPKRPFCITQIASVKPLPHLTPTRSLSQKAQNDYRKKKTEEEEKKNKKSKTW